MSLAEELHPASYRGIPFFVNSSDMSGGRKDTQKKFVDSDKQKIEDLGLDQRVYVVNATIFERTARNNDVIKTYLQGRDDLLEALESADGPGILIHPWYGRIENVVVRSFSLTENIHNLGDGNLTITFEISNSDGVPIATTAVLTEVSRKHQAVASTAQSSLASIWKVATETFQDGIDKANNFIDAVNDATAPLATIATQINKHASLISEFSAKVASLVAAPQALSDSINNIMSSVGGLFSTAEGTLDAFGGLFDFGDTDVSSPIKTAESIQRMNNNSSFNATVQATALSFSYLNASKVEYETVEEIVDAASKLEIQFRKLFSNRNVDPEIIEALIDLRVTTQGFFEEQKLTASQVITIDVLDNLSARLIAFQHYGSSENGAAISELNGLFNHYSTTGELRILTK